MRSLYEIAVRINELGDDDPTHVELCVETAFDSGQLTEFGNPTVEQGNAALTHLAGVLARMAVVLQGWVDLERQEHGCQPWLNHTSESRPYWIDGCTLSVPESAILHPSRDWGGPPGVWITIPIKRQKYWLDLISDTLAEIGKPDRERQ